MQKLCIRQVKAFRNAVANRQKLLQQQVRLDRREMCRLVWRRIPDAEFPLSWSLLSRLHGGLSRSTAERRIEELVQRGYLKRETLKGCPATWWYVIVFRCVKNETSTCSNRPPTGRVTNGASGCRENDAHHISNSFQEKIIKKRSVGAAAAAGAAAPTQRQPIPPARIKAINVLKL